MFEWNLFRQNDLVGRALKAREDEIREEDAERNKEREEMAGYIRKDAESRLKIRVTEARVVSQRDEDHGKWGRLRRLNLEIDHPRGASHLSQVTLRCAYTQKSGGSASFSGTNWAIGRHIHWMRRALNGAKHWLSHDWAPPTSKRVEWTEFKTLRELGEIVNDERYSERFNIPDSAKFQGDKLTWNEGDKV